MEGFCILSMAGCEGEWVSGFVRISVYPRLFGGTGIAIYRRKCKSSGCLRFRIKPIDIKTITMLTVPLTSVSCASDDGRHGDSCSRTPVFLHNDSLKS